jgi:hypothetical protein
MARLFLKVKRWYDRELSREWNGSYGKVTKGFCFGENIFDIGQIFSQHHARSCINP